MVSYPSSQLSGSCGGGELSNCKKVSDSDDEVVSSGWMLSLFILLVFNLWNNVRLLVKLTMVGR